MINACDTQLYKTRGVLQVNDKGAMPFDNISEAARAMGVSWTSLKSWIGDGKEHMGFKWEWEDGRDGR